MTSLTLLLSFEKEMLRQEIVRGGSLFSCELGDIRRYLLNAYRNYINHPRKLNKNSK